MLTQGSELLQNGVRAWDTKRDVSELHGDLEGFLSKASLPTEVAEGGLLSLGVPENVPPAEIEVFHDYMQPSVSDSRVTTCYGLR